MGCPINRKGLSVFKVGKGASGIRMPSERQGVIRKIREMLSDRIMQGPVGPKRERRVSEYSADLLPGSACAPGIP